MKDVTEFSSSTCRSNDGKATMAMTVDRYMGAECCSGVKTACTAAKEASPVFDNPSVCKNRASLHPTRKVEAFSGQTCKAYMTKYFDYGHYAFKKLNADVCASMKDSSSSAFAQFAGLCCSDTHYACNPLPTSGFCCCVLCNKVPHHYLGWHACTLTIKSYIIY